MTLRLIFFYILLNSIDSLCQTSNIEEYGSLNGGLFSFYQKYISGIKGDANCSMYPSCSQYAKVAFASTNPIKAYVKVCERLLCCGRDRHSNNQFINVNGINFIYDPFVPKKNIVHTNDTVTKTFADELLKNKEYDLLLLEYRKQLFECNIDSIKQYLKFKIAKCYYNTKNFDKVSEIYSKFILDINTKKTILDSITLLEAKSLYFDKNYSKSNKILEQFNAHESLEYVKLKAAIEMQLHNWKNAQLYLTKMNSYNNNPNWLFIETKASEVKQKKTSLALTMSLILPGAGYFYAKKPSTAIAAIILNGIFIWIAADSFKNKNYPILAASIFLGSGWYFGAASGSANAVKKYNKNQYDDFIDNNLKNIQF